MTAPIAATLIPGDGIGPEIVDATLTVLDALGAPFEWDRQIAGLAEVIVAKNRHGGTGKERLRFEGRFTKFSDLAEEDRLPELRG